MDNEQKQTNIVEDEYWCRSYIALYMPEDSYLWNGVFSRCLPFLNNLPVYYDEEQLNQIDGHHINDYIRKFILEKTPSGVPDLTNSIAIAIYNDTNRCTQLQYYLYNKHVRVIFDVQLLIPIMEYLIGLRDGIYEPSWRAIYTSYTYGFKDISELMQDIIAGIIQDNPAKSKLEFRQVLSSSGVLKVGNYILEPNSKSIKDILLSFPEIRENFISLIECGKRNVNNFSRINLDTEALSQNLITGSDDHESGDESLEDETVKKLTQLIDSAIESLNDDVKLHIELFKNLSETFNNLVSINADILRINEMYKAIITDLEIQDIMTPNYGIDHPFNTVITKSRPSGKSAGLPKQQTENTNYRTSVIHRFMLDKTVETESRYYSRLQNAFNEVKNLNPLQDKLIKSLQTIKEKYTNQLEELKASVERGDQNGSET